MGHSRVPGIWADERMQFCPHDWSRMTAWSRMATVTVPTQSELALEKANVVRTGIARIKQTIRDLPSPEGRELVAVLLEHPSGHVPSMQVGALLTAIDRVGYGRASKWICLVGVKSADRHVGDLSPRQRSELARILRAVS